MAAKYAFTTGLKELRFHLCQTSEHSAAARYAISITEREHSTQYWQVANSKQEFPHKDLPSPKEAKPKYPDPDPGGIGCGTKGLGAIWYVDLHITLMVDAVMK